MGTIQVAIRSYSSHREIKSNVEMSYTSAFLSKQRRSKCAQYLPKFIVMQPKEVKQNKTAISSSFILILLVKIYEFMFPRNKVTATIILDSVLEEMFRVSVINFKENL